MQNVNSDFTVVSTEADGRRLGQMLTDMIKLYGADNVQHSVKNFIDQQIQNGIDELFNDAKKAVGK